VASWRAKGKIESFPQKGLSHQAAVFLRVVNVEIAMSFGAVMAEF
jgi:hypothetical protein